MKAILGKKMEMTQIFREDGTVVPVTLVKAGPCTVTMVRENPQGEATAILGFDTKKSVAKPQKDDWKELGTFAITQEFKLKEDENVERGQKIDVTAFEVGNIVNVIGISKGRGFQGVVKRHHFHGSPKSHGHKDQLRMGGSIGASGPQRVFKGVRMPGHMGQDKVTVKNLEVIKVDAENNLIALKGAVPGSRGSFVTIIATESNVWHK